MLPVSESSSNNEDGRRREKKYLEKKKFHYKKQSDAVEIVGGKGRTSLRGVGKTKRKVCDLKKLTFYIN